MSRAALFARRRQELLIRGRAAAEAGMVDTCQIRRVTAQTTDDLTGEVDKTYADPDPYTGKCRVQQTRLPSSADHEAGQDTIVLLTLEVQLPMAVTGLQLGDEITVTASQDPDLVGRTFLVRALAHKTEATARRVQCRERED